MSDSSHDKHRSSSSLSNQSDEKNINGKRKHLNTNEETSTNATGRKKYNVINEDVRKKIIKKLTEESANIKEVAQEYGLKLSTCKAILQVYQKEGRIGKKATRDRKSKIVSTILVTRIDPMNPSTSTITPYIHITEAKTASKKGDENAQADLIKEAFKNAQDHVRSVIHQNSQEIYFGNKVPSSCKRELESSFLEAQRDAIKNLLRNNPLPSNETSKGHSSPETGNKQLVTAPSFSPYNINNNNINNNNNNNNNNNVNNMNQNNIMGVGMLPLQQLSSGKSIEGPSSNMMISPRGKTSFKQCNNQQNSLIQSNNQSNITGIMNQTNQMNSNMIDNNINQQLGLQYDTTSLSNNMQDPNDQMLGIQESQKKIKSVSKLNSQKKQQQQQQQQQQLLQAHNPHFAHPNNAQQQQGQQQQQVQQQQQPQQLQQGQTTSSSGINQGFNGFSNSQNVSANCYPTADANLIIDQYNQNLKNNTGWNEGANFNNQSQYTFNNIYSPKQTGFNYTDSPSMSTMNASPAITPFLNPFTLNSPSMSSTQNNYATSFLSPLNLALNSNTAPQGHKPSQFSLNSNNYGQEDIAKKQFISKDNQRKNLVLLTFNQNCLHSTS